LSIPQFIIGGVNSILQFLDCVFDFGNDPSAIVIKTV